MRLEQECQRCFGSNQNIKLIRGKVVSSSIQRVNNNSQQTTFITGEVKEVIARYIKVYTSTWESSSSEAEEDEKQEGEEEQSEDDFVPDVSSSSNSSASSVPQNEARPGFEGRRDARFAAGMSAYEAS